MPYVHNHWVECITSSYYGQLHGHSEREIMLASAELREQNRESHVRTPIDAKRLADFLAKIEAYEAMLLQRQRTSRIRSWCITLSRSQRKSRILLTLREKSATRRRLLT